jgi:PST family polysaccharide transporter
MTLWVVPHIIWCLRGTMISPWDLALTAVRPLCSGTVAAVFAFGVQYCLGPSVGPFVRLMLEGSAMFIVYAFVLLFVLGQRSFYMDLLEGLKRSTGSESFGRAEPLG